jgi:hypothetical protein
MIEQSPILITGIPRSGTSIVAVAINQCGAFLGKTSKRDMYENSRIKSNIVKSYFHRMGVDPRGQFPLPNTEDLSIPMDWRKRIEQIILEEGYQEGPWMYKGTGMSLVWPVWHYAFPNAKWIIVRRRTPDIIHSCLKTGYMNAYSESEEWKEWIHNYEKKFVEMITAGLNCKQIWPERMVTGDYQQLYEVLDWVSLSWNNELVNLINPLFWNSPQKKKGVGDGNKNNS